MPRALRELLARDGERMATYDDPANPAYAELARDMARYDRRSCVASIAGLLTEPAYQTAALRLELLLHIAGRFCVGTRRVTKRALARWVNEVLGKDYVRRMEDPVEDVFVSNVVGGGGNYRVFEGTWERNDEHLQVLLDLVYFHRLGRERLQLRRSLEALLLVSEALAARAGLPRWATTNQEFPATEILRRIPELGALQRRVTFASADLAKLGVDVRLLEPFVLTGSWRGDGPGTVRTSALIRRPLLRAGEEVVVASPAAISMAARLFILDTAAAEGWLGILQDTFDSHQREALFGRLLRRLDLRAGCPPPERLGPTRGASPPRFVAGEAYIPFDSDKVAHVVLITDDLADVRRTGPAADVSLAEADAEHFSRYVTAGVDEIRSAGLDGMTVLAIGGLGRGMSLTMAGVPPQWIVVPVTLPDLATFAATEGACLLRLWKLKVATREARAQGVRIANVNGTLNLYAFWQHQEFMLVPPAVAVPQPHGMLNIGPNFLYDLRVAVRRLADVHAAPYARGVHLRVRRVHEHPFFRSIAQRPVYVADEELAAGRLIGVVEQGDVLVWLEANRHGVAARAASTIYRTWDALLLWLDRLLPRLSNLVAPQPERDGRRPDGHRSGGAGVRGAVIRRINVQLEDADDWASDDAPAEPMAPARPYVSLTRGADAAMQEVRRVTDTAPVAAFASTAGPAEGDAGSGAPWDEGKPHVIIRLPRGFQSLLNRAPNDGERALLEEVGYALVLSMHQPGPEAADKGVRDAFRSAVVEAVAACMGGPDARAMHVWHTTNPLDLVDATEVGEPRFVAEEDRAAWQLAFAHRAGLRGMALDETTSSPALTDALPGADGARREAPVRITGERPVVRALHAAVDELWRGLREQLTLIDGPALVDLLTRNLESIFRDRSHWRRTARALLALHGETDDVADISGRREADRARASAAGRVLIEMALCECRASGGRCASLSDLDRALAGVALLLEIAADADAVRGGLMPAELAADPNGALRLDGRTLADVVGAYGRDTHAAELKAAAAGYDALFAPRAGRGGDESEADIMPAWSRDDAFAAAYHAEFGLTYDRVIDAVAELLDLANGEGRVVRTTRGEIRERLRERRGYTDTEVEAFFGAMALERRARWDEAPPGFLARDWEPWRYRRRLSVSARPLACFGGGDDAPCIFGVAQLGASLTYVLEAIRSAWLPTEYFRSEEMRRYRGSVAERLGLDFEREVASRCQEVGWFTRQGVSMRSLGAPDQLGDVDVIVWRADRDVLWLVECKRLQPTRTITEIVERLRQFRGESGDALGRHLSRTAWVRRHWDAVRQALRLPETVRVAEPLLVTSARMPMRYASGLAIPSNQIVFAEDLASVLDAEPAAAGRPAPARPR